MNTSIEKISDKLVNAFLKNKIIAPIPLRYTKKLTEAQKPLAICGILIALKDESFRSNLSKFKIEDIPDEWYSALRREINKANIPNLKKQNILTSFKLEEFTKKAFFSMWSW